MKFKKNVGSGTAFFLLRTWTITSIKRFNKQNCPPLLKIGHSRPLFSLFSVLFKQTLQFLQQIHVDNVHPVKVLGFKLTTFRRGVSSLSQ